MFVLRSAGPGVARTTLAWFLEENESNVDPYMARSLLLESEPSSHDEFFLACVEKFPA